MIFFRWPDSMERDSRIEGGRGDPLVLRQQVVRESVEVTDAPDHRRAGHDLVHVRGQTRQQRRVLGVALHERVAGMVVVGPAHGAVLAEVIQADDLGGRAPAAREPGNRQ